jgi:hypothetical protein
MQFRGEVVRHAVARGSKSARPAVLLRTADREYVLRRQGGNPFHDPVLDALVGHTIAGEGTLHDDHVLIMSTWHMVDTP